ncbi:MAG: hypothetical protein ACP5NQ_06035 [Vulcanisaeta sp.]
MRLVLPAFDYRVMYRGLLSVRGDNKILIRKLDTVTLRLNLPINPIATHAVRLELNAVKKLMSTIKHGDNEYPLIFVFNPNYGQLSPTSRTPIAYLGGVSILGSTEDQGINYLIGYSKAWVYENGEWRRSTRCGRGEGEPETVCKLYLTLVVDPEVLRGLRQGERVGVEVHIDDEVLTADDVTLYSAEYRSVNTFERSFIELEEPKELYASQCVSSKVNDKAMISLCPADAEVIHLGAQLVVKGMVNNIVEGKRRYVYFVMPTVISYPAKLPRDSMSDTALPKDYMFNTALLKFSIVDFNWNDALKLIDWLWSEHRDAVLKLFLNMDVMRSLWQIFRDNVGNTRPPFVEHTVTTQFYDKYLVNYSLNLWQFTDMYYRISRNHMRIADLVAEIFKLNNIDVKVSDGKEEMVKGVLALYALMYGLHGISHLLMKTLSALAGLSSYGELINITIDVSGLAEDVLGALSMNLFDTHDRRVYHENVFHITPGSQFRLDVEVFSRKGYSFHHFRELLGDGSGSLDINKLIGVMNQILLANSEDRCGFNWRMERRHLEFGRVRFLDEQLSKADNELRDWLSKHYKPARSLFRVLFSYRLVWGLTDALMGGYGNETKDARSRFVRRLNRYVQFMWPYHLEQCVDGCYNCVLVSRSIKSSTCDMTPLMQELKTSKWAALYLLKYAGLFNAAWVD